MAHAISLSLEGAPSLASFETTAGTGFMHTNMSRNDSTNSNEQKNTKEINVTFLAQDIRVGPRSQINVTTDLMSWEHTILHLIDIKVDNFIAIHCKPDMECIETRIGNPSKKGHMQMRELRLKIDELDEDGKLCVYDCKDDELQFWFQNRIFVLKNVPILQTLTAYKIQTTVGPQVPIWTIDSIEMHSRYNCGIIDCLSYYYCTTVERLKIKCDFLLRREILEFFECIYGHERKASG